MRDNLPNNRDDYPDRERAIAEGQIRHEDTLINARMSWLMSSNFFLFSAFGVLVNLFVQNQAKWSTSLPLGAFFITPPLVGMILSWVIWELVMAATNQVDKVSRWWDKLFEPGSPYGGISKDDAYPPLIGIAIYGLTGRMNVYSIIPFILALAWGMIFCISLAALDRAVQVEIVKYAAFLLVSTISFGLISYKRLVGRLVNFCVGLFIKPANQKTRKKANQKEG